MMKKFVFDGLSYAKNVIDDHNIDEKNANEHMMLLAKYNFHAKKMDDTSNYHSIIQYMSTYWKGFMEADHQQKIEDFIKNAHKFGFKSVESVKITRKELNFIASLGNIRLEKVAFVLLCIAKYECYYHDEPKYWICWPLNAISKLARVHVTKNENLKLFRELVLTGAIESNSSGVNLYEHILFVSDGKDDEVVLELSENDYKELAYTYLYYKNGFSGYIHCEKCGRLVKQKSNRQKFCDECAAINEQENIKNRVRRYRRKCNDLEA